MFSFKVSMWQVRDQLKISRKIYSINMNFTCFILKSKFFKTCKLVEMLVEMLFMTSLSFCVISLLRRIN